MYYYKLVSVRTLMCVTLISTASIAHAAWTGPTSTPPNNNADTPVNIGSTSQTKLGTLGAYGFFLEGAAPQYINFGTTLGASGFGIRNNGGTLEYKNSGGTWAAVGSGGGTSQWTTSASDIYYNTGNVGVGASTVSPIGSGGARMQITQSGTNPGLWVTGGTNPMIETVDSTSGVVAKMQSLNGGPAYVGTQSPHDLRLITGNSPKMSIVDTTGNVGIGTISPSFKLSLAGTSSTADRKLGINGTQTLYLPDQTPFLGSFFVGNGGASLSNTAGSEGQGNTSLGINALFYNTTGSTNTGIGQSSLWRNTTGIGNTGTGYASLYNNTTGNYNTATGMNALSANTTGTANTATGHNSLTANTTGSYNTALGTQALSANTTGTLNTATGYASLFSNTTGNNNMGYGHSSLYFNTTGSDNVAMGVDALRTNTTGFNNVGVGTYALQGNTTGNNNVAVGKQALQTNTTGAGNFAAGSAALFSNSGGIANVGVGEGTLYSNAAGRFNTGLGFNAGRDVANSSLTGANTFVGAWAGRGMTVGTGNIIIGAQETTGTAPSGITTGSNNTIIGTNVGGLSANLSNNIILADGTGAQRLNIDSTGKVGLGATAPGFKLELAGTAAADRKMGINGTQILYLPDQAATAFTGSLFVGDGGNSLSHTSGAQGYYNTGIGKSALSSVTVGTHNTASGFQALTTNTTGNYNTASGANALLLNTSGLYNTALGAQALYSNTTGAQNTGVGLNALYSTTSGNYNTATGAGALQLNTTGSQNTAQGLGTLYQNTTGSNNAAMGMNSLYSNTVGTNNTAFGYSTLYSGVSGSYNTAIGNYSGYDLAPAVADTGTNTFIGYNTGRGVTTGAGNTIIGAQVTGLAAGLTNTVILADGAGTQRLVINGSGNAGIGVAPTSSKLAVGGVIESTTGGVKFPDGTVQTTASGISTCTLPWGGVIYPGQTVKAYQDAVRSGATMSLSETRTCSASGVLSGSYTNETTRGDFLGAGGATSWEEAADYPGGNYLNGRFLISSDQTSVNKKCQMWGYQTGRVTAVYTSAAWCGTYSNARTKRWIGSSWEMGGCENYSVQTASCYP